MNTDDIRMVTWMPRTLYQRLHRASEACGEPFPDFIRHRLADSLPLSQAAPRSGCAGEEGGEVLPSKLGAQSPAGVRAIAR